MRRIPVSCSILTPRLNARERRRGWLTGLGMCIAVAAYQIASLMPYLAGPVIACALCLFRWLTMKMPVPHVHRIVANDNDDTWLSYSYRPVLKSVSVLGERPSAPRTGDAA